MRIATSQHMRIALALIVSTALGALAAAVSVGSAPGLKERTDLQIAAASTHVLVALPDVRTPGPSRRPSEEESIALTDTLGAIMASPPVIEKVARRAGMAPDRIAATSRTTANVPAVLNEPASEERARDILLANRQYRLDIQARPTASVLEVYAQAPSTPEAVGLANAAVDGLRDYLRGRAASQGVDNAALVRLRQLGDTRGSVINSGTRVKIAGLTFMITFALAFFAMLRFVGVRRSSAPDTPEERDTAPAPSDERSPVAAAGFGSSVLRRLPSRTSPALMAATAAAFPGQIAVPVGHAPITETAPAPPATTARSGARAGDWPHTHRVLPWMIAGFLAVLWLVPFESIQMAASLPIDMKLDRVLLPFVVATWVLWLATSGLRRLSFQFTWVHAAVGAFVALACLSIIFDARDLNQTLELDLALKKLTLLFAYVSLFAVIATGVRRSEVPAFLKYTLILAVLCAIGTIWEFRFHYNVFYSVAQALFPGFVSDSAADSSAVDEIGRRLVHGPARHPLEAVAMLSMALPIALTGLIRSPERRERILYGIAACLLLAAAISTYRKSAVLVPLSVGLAVAYFHPREVVRMAPLAVAMFVAIHILSPGALGSVVSQLDSQRLGVTTVSDRTSDYDAIRPDLWSHMALGRGFGSYEHTTYRILDSEYLSRLVEMGVLGLLAYILMAVAVVATARATIRSKHPVWAPAALACAGAAVAFLVVSALFDVLSFPHAPYIFLTMAALLTVIVKPPRLLS